MKPAPFAYHDPRTRSELSGLLASLENAKLLAGGQSLMPMLNLRLLAPDHVIDLNRVEGLSGLALNDGRLEIGALTRQSDLEAAADIGAHLPILQDALAYVGHDQTRSRGTIGGSCCHLDPAAEIPAICALYDADFVVGGPNGSRIVAASDWFQGFLQSALDEREVLEAIRFVPWRRGHGYGFAEYARRHGDYAITGAAALLETEAGVISRIALVVFGVGPEPVRLAEAEQALLGAAPTQEAFAAAAAVARRLDAMNDSQAPSAYRQRLAGVTIERALAAAAARVDVGQ